MLANHVIEAEIVSLLVICLRILIYSNECSLLHCNLAPHVCLWKTVTACIYHWNDDARHETPKWSSWRLLPGTSFPEYNRVGKVMPSCPYLDLHRSSRRSSATVGDWGKWKWGVFQNSSGRQITSALQRTAVPWLLQGLKNKIRLFPASDLCVSCYKVKQRSNRQW